MSYTYITVSIDSVSYAVFGDIGSADQYLAASISAEGTAWRAADVTTKSRADISAVRWLDSAPWIGQKTDPVQELSWPRTGIPDVDPDVIPDAVAFASFELASYLVADPDLRTTIKDPKVREEHAGVVGHTFFRPTDVQLATIFPASVMALIGLWLSSSVAGAPKAYGTHGKSRLHDLDLIHGI